MEIFKKIAGKLLWWTAALFAFCCLVGPFVIMVAASFQETRTYFESPWDWLPTDPTWKNYEILFQRSSVVRWIWNSLVISVVPVAGSIAFSVLLGYIFAKKYFPGREVIFWTMLASIMIPFQVTLAPLYLLMNAINWVDTYQVMIFPYLLNVTGIFLMRQFIQSIPDSLEEAAIIDGCSPWLVVWHVIVPLSKTAIATLATLGFITAWNNFLFPLIFTASERMRPLTVGLATFSDTTSSFGINMAAATINFLPTFIIFLMFQRHFVKGIALGGMKL